jgi:hypothetical protein
MGVARYGIFPWATPGGFMEVTGSFVDAVELLKGIGVDVVVDQKDGKPGNPAHVRVSISQDEAVLSTGKGTTVRAALFRALLSGFGVPDETIKERFRSIPSEERIAENPDATDVQELEAVRILLLASALTINADATVDDVGELLGDDDDDDTDDEGDEG